MRRCYNRGGGSTKNGVYIGYTDGSVSYFDAPPESGKTVKGVVLKTDNICICIHKTEGSSKEWSTNTAIQIAGVTTTTRKNTAKKDYTGKANTDAAIASGWADTAFKFATALGSEWYLPACGEMEEIRLNVDNINTAMDRIGGTQLNFSNKNYWSSTQYSKNSAWQWYSGVRDWIDYTKGGIDSCRAVCAFDK